MAIKPMSELADSAFRELYEIQTGEKKIVKTGFPIIDDHIGGLLASDTLIISGLSGHGKSEFLFRLQESAMSEKVNDGAEDFVWLNYNLEVPIFNVVLRGIQRKLGKNKKKKDILFNEFSEEEKDLARQYYEMLQDDRQYVEQETTTSDDFYNRTKAFLEEHKEKSAIFVSFDHAALNADKDTQKGIEELIKNVNKLRLEYSNVYYIIISQLNRSILSRINEKDNASAPNASDLYASSTMDFISSYNIVIFNPNKLGIEQFMKVNPDRYDYLSEHFGDADSKGRISFKTAGKLFFKIIKTRESDVVWKDLYIMDMDLTDEEREKLESRTQTPTPNFGFMNSTEPPVFDGYDNSDVPLGTVEDAFDKKRDVPF